MREINKMKWLDEEFNKRKEELSDGRSCGENEYFIIGFDTATKAISEKLKETVDQCSHDADCRYCESLPWTITNCDCWKAKLKELGLV